MIRESRGVTLQRYRLPIPQASYWTALRYYAAARVFVSGGLVFLGVLAGLDDQFDFFSFSAEALVIAWFLACLVSGAVLSRSTRAFWLQLLIILAVDDFAAFGLLRAVSGDFSSTALLLMLPACAGAVLLPTRWAMAQASFAAVLLLVDGSLRALAADDFGPIFNAGLVGAMTLGLTFLVRLLAQRLADQEALAEERGAALVAQLAVTAAVVAQTDVGVIELGPTGRVQLNPAALELLGRQESEARLRSESSQSVLPRELLHQLATIEPGRLLELSWTNSIGSAERVLEIRRVEGLGKASDRAVYLLKDKTEAARQAQQLKLASMGRLTASIAHEVRNPLATIRHANGLLAEEIQDGVGRRLVKMIEDNVIRINRVIEDVLTLSHREPARENVRLKPFVVERVSEFESSEPELHAQRRVSVDVADEVEIAFDGRHLRRIMMNLLSNALRYASDDPGSVRIVARSIPGLGIELAVGDNGPGLSETQRAQVFEPFYTTAPRGTGLGLFMAKELAEANRSSLSWQAGHTAGVVGAFVMILPQIEA